MCDLETGNVAGEDAGAVLSAYSSFITEQQSTTLFKQNQCNRYGGGLYSLNLPTNVAQFGGDVQFQQNTAFTGGGAWVQGGVLTLNANSTFVGT